jgi:hypothetical protein
VVSAANSLVGLISGLPATNLSRIIVDNVNGNYYAPFVVEGRVRVASQADGLSGPAFSTTTATSSVSQAVFGQAVTFTATVTAAASSTSAPTGTVTFLLDGVTPLATSALDSFGHATITTSMLSVGMHTITAVYSGDSNFLAGPSAVLTETVLSAQAELDLIIVQVNAMVSSGILDSGNGNALIVKLNNAITNINSGNTTAGDNQMNAFINQANAFLKSGKLDSTDVQMLINDIDLAIAAALAQPI